MFSKIIDNIPSIQNKKYHKINYLEKFENVDKTAKIENFDDFVHPLNNIDEHHDHVDLPEQEQEIVFYQ